MGRSALVRRPPPHPTPHPGVPGNGGVDGAGGLDVSALADPWAAVRALPDGAPFLVAAFDPAVKARVVAAAVGAGGEALRSALPDDAVAFGGLGYRVEVHECVCLRACACGAACACVPVLSACSACVFC